MKPSKAGAEFFLIFIFGISGQASADFLEEFSRTQAFAYETLRLLRPEAVVEAGSYSTREDGANKDVRARARKRKPTTAEIDRLIDEKAASYGISPDFIRAVVKVESGYDVSARSPKGAMGLMQLMPATASDLRVENPWDPGANLEGGIFYLAKLLWEFRDVRDALVAYNAGPEVVRKRQGLPHETRRYIQLVLGNFRRLVAQRKERMLEDPHGVTLAM